MNWSQPGLAGAGCAEGAVRPKGSSRRARRKWTATPGSGQRTGRAGSPGNSEPGHPERQVAFDVLRRTFEREEHTRSRLPEEAAAWN